jgi:hypothetical protein
MVMRVRIQRVVIHTLAATNGSLILGVGVVMLMMVLSCVSNGMSSITACSDVLQSLETIVRHDLIMKFEVQVFPVTSRNVDERPVGAVWTLWAIPTEVLEGWCS